VSLRDKFYFIDATAVVPPENSELPADPSSTVVVVVLLLLLLLFRFLPPNSNIFTLRSFVWMDVTYHDDS